MGNDEGMGRAADAATAEPGRISFERLRERTDELELLLSGLFAFSLVTLPQWLFQGWAEASAHAAGSWRLVLVLGFSVGSGLSYLLAAGFLAHLCVRAYWVGLIGLKATFTRGIRWDSLRVMGPLSREYYRARMPDLGSAIDRTDRAASILFSIAVLVAILLVWTGLLMVASIAAGGALGYLMGDVERGVWIGYIGLGVALAGGSLVLLLVDSVLVVRRPALQQSGPLRAAVFGLIRLYGLLMPMRLILPVQLMLQSNLKARVFSVMLGLMTALAPLVGLSHWIASRTFSLGGGYAAFDSATVEHGLRSAHYESLRGDGDRLLPYPMIPDDQVSGALLRVFIPHLPERDNTLLAARCPASPGAAADAGEADAAAAQAERQRACFAGLWRVTLDGLPVTLDDFVAAERRDLGLRGLMGQLPMHALAPGRHDLVLAWNPDGPETGRDRRRLFRIPFWLSPGLDQPAAAVPAAAPPETATPGLEPAG